MGAGTGLRALRALLQAGGSNSSLFCRPSTAAKLPLSSSSSGLLTLGRSSTLCLSSSSSSSQQWRCNGSSASTDSNTQWYPQVTSQFSDLPAAEKLLPNRRAFMLGFSAHGVEFIPAKAPAELSVWSTEDVDRAFQFSLLELPFHEDLVEDSMGDENEKGLHAIGIKTWRRMKMKKHKIRKRRKANRHKAKL